MTVICTYHGNTNKLYGGETWIVYDRQGKEMGIFRIKSLKPSK